MADEEDGRLLEHAGERCSLLKSLKHTVETQLVSYSSDSLDKFDDSRGVKSDLLRIMKHGQCNKVQRNPKILKVKRFHRELSENCRKV